MASLLCSGGFQRCIGAALQRDLVMAGGDLGVFADTRFHWLRVCTFATFGSENLR